MSLLSRARPGNFAPNQDLPIIDQPPPMVARRNCVKIAAIMVNLQFLSLASARQV
jgi:hypothetical protein